MSISLQKITRILTALAFVVSVDASAADDFKKLFNGKNLKGWSGHPDLWSVQDGVIVGKSQSGRDKIKHNHFLSTKKSYSDFVLRVKVKLINHNSGIQFRSEQRDDFVVAGYQADIADNEYYGMLYEEQKRGILPYWKEMSAEGKAEIAAAVKKDDWNQYEITCKGDQITMVLNGVTTLDMNDPEGAKEGIVALQLHAGPAMEVQFKDIEIKVLD
jgi:hypothetical protein